MGEKATVLSLLQGQVTNQQQPIVGYTKRKKEIPKLKQDERGEAREKAEKLPTNLNTSIPLRGGGGEGYGSLLVEFRREQWGKVGLFWEV